MNKYKEITTVGIMVPALCLLLVFPVSDVENVNRGCFFFPFFSFLLMICTFVSASPGGHNPRGVQELKQSNTTCV